MLFLKTYLASTDLQKESEKKKFKNILILTKLCMDFKQYLQKINFFIKYCSINVLNFICTWNGIYFNTHLCLP